MCEYVSFLKLYKSHEYKIIPKNPKSSEYNKLSPANYEYPLIIHSLNKFLRKSKKS
jgi:hypothetical protein